MRNTHEYEFPVVRMVYNVVLLLERSLLLLVRLTMKFADDDSGEHDVDDGDY